MSSRVKQANFRLPLEYMAMIDEFAARDNLTKAAVITRALDCMKASYDSGHGGMPVTGGVSGDSSAEVTSLKDSLAQAQNRIADLERQLATANQSAVSAQAASSASGASSAAQESEIARLRAVVASQEASLEEKTRNIAAKEAELAAKNAELAAGAAEIRTKTSQISERETRIATLERQLSAANAKSPHSPNANAVVTSLAVSPEASGDPASAMQLFNMLGGVMGAFRQQVEDARVLGEQEGRRSANVEFKDVVDKARNDGYREAMTYLDDRITTARETGAKEERARIANMRFFERRRYLSVHYA